MVKRYGPTDDPSVSGIWYDFNKISMHSVKCSTWHMMLVHTMVSCYFEAKTLIAYPHCIKLCSEQLISVHDAAVLSFLHS